MSEILPNSDTGLADTLRSVAVMNDDKTNQDQSVSDFFDGYARALSEVDLDALADAYAYPSLAVSRAGTQAITGPAMTRAFFDENAKRYTATSITRQYEQLYRALSAGTARTS